MYKHSTTSSIGFTNKTKIDEDDVVPPLSYLYCVIATLGWLSEIVLTGVSVVTVRDLLDVEYENDRER